MQLSVTQTITSTENNYKGNVNFGDRLFVLESKISNRTKKKKQTDKKKKTTYKNESQFIDTEEKRKTKISYKHSLQG